MKEGVGHSSESTDLLAISTVSSCPKDSFGEFSSGSIVIIEVVDA
jgi:hypothetical protein